MPGVKNDSDGVIVLMGATGAGKSYFINQLKKDGAVEGHGLRSQTTQCQSVNVEFGDEDSRRTITVVDTPGFDDTERPQAEIFSEISEYLTTLHEVGVPVKGVLYLHKITDNRMTGSSRMFLDLFEDIVGEAALKNVILLTTMWNKLRDEDEAEAERREQQLIDEFWQPMVDKGSITFPFRGTPEAATALVYRLASKESVVLKVQEEGSDGKAAGETSAGTTLYHNLQADKGRYQTKLIELDRKLERHMRWGDREGEKRVRREIAQVESVVTRLGLSLDHLSDRQGSRARMKRWYQETSARMEHSGVTTAIMALASVFGFAVSIVRLVGGA